jgi:hypothetical protein
MPSRSPSPSSCQWPMRLRAIPPVVTREIIAKQMPRKQRAELATERMPRPRILRRATRLPSFAYLSLFPAIAPRDAWPRWPGAPPRIPPIRRFVLARFPTLSPRRQLRFPAPPLQNKHFSVMSQRFGQRRPRRPARVKAAEGARSGAELSDEPERGARTATLALAVL